MKKIDRITTWQYLTSLKEGKLLVVIGEGVTDDFVSRTIPPNMQVEKLYFKEIKKKNCAIDIVLPDNSVGKAVVFGQLDSAFKACFFKELYRVLEAEAGICFFVSQRMASFSLRRSLEVCGFKSVRIYGVFPDFNYPRWVVPLSSKYFISSTKGVFKPVKFIKKICWKLVVPFSYTKAPFFMVKNSFVIAEKGLEVSAKKDEGIRTLLKKLFEQKDLELALLNRPRKYYQKTNAQVMDSKGNIIAYVKIGDTPQVKRLIGNEYKILEILKKLDVESADVPYVTYFDENEQQSIIVQRAESTLRDGPIYISNEHILFMAEIFCKTAKVYKFEESPLISNMDKSLRNLKGQIEEEWLDLLKLTFEKIYKRFSGKEIQLGLAHWDFAAWNTCRNDKGKLIVFDWELAIMEEIPMFDFYNFIINTEGMIKYKKGEEILSILLNEKSFYFRLINQYKTALGHDIFFDRIGFLLVYLYKANIFNLYLENLQKRVGFNKGRRIQLLGILRAMLEGILKIY